MAVYSEIHLNKTGTDFKRNLVDFLSDMHIFCTFQPNVYLLILELVSNFLFFKINVPFISERLGVGKGKIKVRKGRKF